VFHWYFTVQLACFFLFIPCPPSLNHKSIKSLNGIEGLISFRLNLPWFAIMQMFQKEQVDPLQMKLQQVNGLGQGLIQSAGKNCDVQGLEHDMDEINARWNTLNKKVSGKEVTSVPEPEGIRKETSKSAFLRT
jgi:hypothetical protein